MANKLTFYKKLYKIRRTKPVTEIIGEKELNAIQEVFGAGFFYNVEPCEYDPQSYRVTYADRWEETECYTDVGKRSDPKVSCKITVDLDDCLVTELPEVTAAEAFLNCEGFTNGF